MANEKYRLGGIDIESELLLPASPSISGAPPTAWIRRGKVAATLAEATVKRVLCEASPAEFLLTVPGIARYLVRGGTEIVVDLLEDALDDDVGRYLVTYVLAALCQQRRLLVLHATAIDFHGRAILFSGPSAAGASTLGAVMALRGHGVLSDHVCVVDVSAGRALVHPVGIGVGLWADTLEYLGNTGDSPSRYLDSLDKFSVSIGPPCDSAMPLGCVAFVEESRSPAPAIHIAAATPMDAVAALMTNSFMPFLVTGPDRQAAHFIQCGEALRHASALRISRRWGLESVPDVLDHVVRFLHD